MIQTVRVAIWSIIFGVVAGMSILGLYYSERQELATARRYLLEKDYERAAQAFDSLGSSFWNSDEARVGFGLSSVLGEGVSGVDFSAASSIESTTVYDPPLISTLD